MVTSNTVDFKCPGNNTCPANVPHMTIVHTMCKAGHVPTEYLQNMVCRHGRWSSAPTCKPGNLFQSITVMFLRKCSFFAFISFVAFVIFLLFLLLICFLFFSFFYLFSIFSFFSFLSYSPSTTSCYSSSPSPLPPFLFVLPP